MPVSWPRGQYLAPQPPRRATPHCRPRTPAIRCLLGRAVVAARRIKCRRPAEQHYVARPGGSNFSSKCPAAVTYQRALSAAPDAAHSLLWNTAIEASPMIRFRDDAPPHDDYRLLLFPPMPSPAISLFYRVGTGHFCFLPAPIFRRGHRLAPEVKIS